jgi:hypothetical protein
MFRPLGEYIANLRDRANPPTPPPALAKGDLHFHPMSTTNGWSRRYCVSLTCDESTRNYFTER